QAWLVAVNQRDQLAIVLLAVGEFAMREHGGFDAGCLGADQAIGVGAVADDGADIGWKLAGLLGVDQSLQIAAVAGDEDHHRQRSAWLHQPSWKRTAGRAG